MSSLGISIGCTDAFAPAPNTDLGLYVWGEVFPGRVSITDSTTEITVRVYVRNPSTREIRVPGGPPVSIAGDPSESSGLSASFRFSCEERPLDCGPGTDWFGDSVYVFPAGETVFYGRRVTLRAWAEGGRPLATRTYFFRVWFGGREGRSATLNIVP